jgi:predicted PurR-regulated permease PerM
MLQLSQIQIWLLLVGSCTMFTLVVWAVFVVIPNRNETITFLKNRNQTLEYWINNINLEKNHSPWLTNMRGTDPEKNLESLLKEHEWLNDQLRKCLINIEHCNEHIRKKNIPDEQK